MSARHNIVLVRRAVEQIWNHGDLDVADILFAPTYVNHGGIIPDVVTGPEAIKMAVALYRTAFPRFQVTVVALLGKASMVELRWSASSIPADDRTKVASADPPETVTGTTLGRLSNDQIVESWTFWDRATVLKRLEIAVSVPTPALEPLPLGVKRRASPLGKHGGSHG